MLNTKTLLTTVVFTAGTFALTACHKTRHNPLLNDIKASTKIVINVAQHQEAAFDAVSLGAEYDGCYDSAKTMHFNYGDKTAAYKKVCQQFVTQVLVDAHQQPLFKSATAKDVLSPKFHDALTNELDKESLG